MKNFFILFFISSLFFAQQVKVTETLKLPINNVEEAYYPQFSIDDSKIIFSSTGYKGLYYYDLINMEISVITEEYGAGYNPLILDSESIFYRSFEINNGKKYHSLYSFNLETKSSEIVVQNKRLLKLPKQLINSDLMFIENSQVQKERINNKTLLNKTNEPKAVFVEDNNLILIENNQQKIINPLGKGVYVWESLSNDGSRIIFSYGSQGTFVCDLQGNVLLNIKDARYPKFSPDGKYISYMNDKDDGYNYISSDILVYSIDLNKSFEVTNTEDKIEMFAEWSNDGNRLVYNTTKGEIFITKLQFEN